LVTVINGDKGEKKLGFFGVSAQSGNRPEMLGGATIAMI
jgi:hypothetical protein